MAELKRQEQLYDQQALHSRSFVSRGKQSTVDPNIGANSTQNSTGTHDNCDDIPTEETAVLERATGELRINCERGIEQPMHQQPCATEVIPKREPSIRRTSF